MILKENIVCSSFASGTFRSSGSLLAGLAIRSSSESSEMDEIVSSETKLSSIGCKGEKGLIVQSK